MWKGLLALLVAALGRAGAQTQVLDFENIPPDNIGINGELVGYGGLTWSAGRLSSWFVDSTPVFRPSSGVSNVATSQLTNIWFERPGEPFTLNSIFLGTYHPGHAEPGRGILVGGSLNGEVIFTTYISASLVTTDQYVFDWTGVDRVDLIDWDGVMLVDDISITTTPEPASLALLASGMVGLVGMARKRRGSHDARVTSKRDLA